MRTIFFYIENTSLPDINVTSPRHRSEHRGITTRIAAGIGTGKVIGIVTDVVPVEVDGPAASVGQIDVIIVRQRLDRRPMYGCRPHGAEHNEYRHQPVDFLQLCWVVVGPALADLWTPSSRGVCSSPRGGSRQRLAVCCWYVRQQQQQQQQQQRCL